MTISIVWLSVLAVACTTGFAAAVLPSDPAAPIQVPPPQKLHLYLLMGQSNMAGRGEIGPEDKTPHPRVIVFTLSNAWQAAIEPITCDRKSGLGVGPGLAFGKAMAEADPAATIGLVPCAVGGTPLTRWERGGDLYSNAVHRARLAMHDGTLKGILWHQGESDSGTEAGANAYGERLGRMIQDIRKDLNTPDLPFVAGQLGEFLYTRGPDKTPYARIVNERLAELPAKVPHSACAKSSGLKHKGDQLHFDADSQREFGKRYAAEMLRLENK